MRKIIAGAAFAAALLAATPAAASPEIGPCGEEDAIVIRAGDVIICVHAVDTNECDANDIVVRVGGRTLCVRVP